MLAVPDFQLCLLYGLKKRNRTRYSTNLSNVAFHYVWVCLLYVCVHKLICTNLKFFFSAIKYELLRPTREKWRGRCGMNYEWVWATNAHICGPLIHGCSLPSHICAPSLSPRKGESVENTESGQNLPIVMCFNFFFGKCSCIFKQNAPVTSVQTHIWVPVAKKIITEVPGHCYIFLFMWVVSALWKSDVLRESPGLIVTLIRRLYRRMKRSSFSKLYLPRWPISENPLWFLNDSSD